MFPILFCVCTVTSRNVEAAKRHLWSLPASLKANIVVEHWNSTGLKRERERGRERKSSIDDAKVSKFVLKQPKNLGVQLGL